MRERRLTRMELAAAPINADPISLGAVLMCFVTAVTIVILAPLRSRRLRVLQVIAVAIAILGLAITTLLFVLSMKTAQSSMPKDANPLESMSFDSSSGIWTLVRDVRVRVWTLATTGALTSLYLFCIVSVLITPAASRYPPSKAVSNNEALFEEAPPSAISASRDRNRRCDLNRIWLNIVALIVGVALSGAFGGAIVSTRKAVEVGKSVPAVMVNTTSKTTRIPEETRHLHNCLCKHIQCSPIPTLSNCRFLLRPPWHEYQMWECLTSVKNATKPQRESIANAIDQCVAREGATTGSTAGIILASAVGSIVLVVFTGSGRALVYTASFLFVSYFAIFTVLISILTVLIAFIEGPINVMYGLSGTLVYLAVVVGPATIRLLRICLVCLYSQLVVMLIAAATEFHKYSMQHTFYDLFAIERNNDDYDRDPYYKPENEG